MFDILGSLAVSDAGNPVWWLLDTAHDTIENGWGILTEFIKDSLTSVGSTDGRN
ncbi:MULTISPECIES: hypothetical protein [Corynebacterium]|jgi:hypothetical protein|uniref:Uncharacterized protein n=1 Tax=Corynebacterium provencense TaxID=1737425 RepID=A0A2Z3YNX2_9CORY|nr:MULTISPECIES: hypothetical protein [Corynebacterium]AWT25579.1 hypothetical protein Csp1_07700 [Corynebacterium provencense]MCI1256391.1 hypothetical protein [Corynebacterium provencense]